MNNTDEIEFSRVRKLVSHYAVSPEAKDKILVQPLATKLVKATALLDETAEMVCAGHEGIKREVLIEMSLGIAIHLLLTDRKSVV